MKQGILSTLVVLSFLHACVSDAAAASHKHRRNRPEDGSDLAFYVTRPEIRPPLWHVTKHAADADIVPGYWLVAPYSSLDPPPRRLEYAPCQAGPLVYDSDGNLVWSGACLDHNRNTFDFKATTYNNDTHLTFIHSISPGANDEKGVAVVMDSSYSLEAKLPALRTSQELNLHEFSIIDQGNRALIISIFDVELDVTGARGSSATKGWVHHDSFQEVDMASGKVLFDWRPLDRGVSVAETPETAPWNLGRNEKYPWDFFHMNSVDKTAAGDYLVSSRWMNTIYKVSGADGSIIWRLGGLKGNFQQDFNFSSQHDARFISEDGTVTILSFFDNATGDHFGNQPTSTASSGLIVAVDTSDMTAKVLKRWYRPDGKLSGQRGNTQILPNGNVLICWSEQGYMSEHTTGGRLLFEAKFVSDRFSTYRAYKFNYTGTPTERPVTKSFAFASGGNTTLRNQVTVSYVSWNGATEVRSWNFYGSSKHDDPSDFLLLGNAKRTGFETMFTSTGYAPYIYAEALGVDGVVLGATSTEQTILADDLGGDSAHNAVLSLATAEKQRQEQAAKQQLEEQQNKKPVQMVSKHDTVLGMGAAVLFTLCVQAFCVFLFLLWKRLHNGRSRPAAKSQQSYSEFGPTSAGEEESGVPLMTGRMEAGTKGAEPKVLFSYDMGSESEYYEDNDDDDDVVDDGRRRERPPK